MNKGNLITFDQYLCKDIDSEPELIRRTAIIVAVHSASYSVVYLDDGTLAAIEKHKAKFLDEGGDFFSSAIFNEIEKREVLNENR